MRVECDRALHEKTTELEELRASETTLRNQLEDTIEVKFKISTRYFNLNKSITDYRL